MTKRMSSIKRAANGPLKDKIIQLIRLKGPISVTEYMRIVLTNPENGFYMNNDVFGVKGHFTTNPEISQIFGEILGVWILQEWKRFNCPKPLQLVEFGPGRGTLMSDIARTLNKFDQTHNSISIRMIELSPKLREIQKHTLAREGDLSNNVRWFNHIEELDDNKSGFTAFLAHEFLDALPIYKFVKDPNSNNSWRELLIDYDKNYNLRYCISKQPSLSTKLLIPPDFDGDHIEVCPDAALQLQKVASKLANSAKGCMLVCDYGFEDEPNDSVNSHPSTKRIKSDRDTFRAFKNHESWPTLEQPGEADLTADVDFGFLKKQLAGKAVTFGSVTQRKFLLECGLGVRINKLLDGAREEEKKDLMTGSSMLIEEMGDRYRFLAMFPKGSEHLFADDPPAGFGMNKRD